jgi:uncharacterized protein YeaO (DUF488 family)
VPKRRDVRLKRAYESADADDGLRVLIDRLWPRGVSKDAARVDVWMKDLAPSASLRKWYGHEPAKWTVFLERYFRELDANPDAVDELRRHIARGPVTLVYGARDREHNQAVAIMEYLRKR